MRMPALSILASAKTLGQEIVAKRKALDQLFSNKTISEQELSRAVDEIGALQGQLRATPLQAHLAEAKVLTRAQTMRYLELRGYTAERPAQAHHEH